MDWYFAYGSNMNPARMQARGVAFAAALSARLPGYELCFNKRAHDQVGAAYANIRHQRDGVVEGVLYRLPNLGEIAKLDVYEGTPVFYSRERFALHSAAGVQAAWVYVANPAFRGDGGLPTRAYLQHLLEGRALLSAAYCQQLAAQPTLDA